MPDHKLFIDECLSPSLVRHAVAAGYYQTTCVRDRGLSGTSDAKLVQLLVQEDFILVTHNACDFRGVPPGTGGLYAQLAIHAGLVCLNSEADISRRIMEQLFIEALNELGRQPDLINRVLEVTFRQDGHIETTIYALPQESAT